MEGLIEGMSRAFVKELDDAAGDELPDRPISPHPNLVTPQGLAQIEAELARLHAAARAAGEDRAARTAIAREERYWVARRASAQVIEPSADTERVRFGATVTLQRDDGREQRFRIVGEDEADPECGTLSHVSPLARALMGKEPGDVVRVGDGDVEIVAIA
ncbi:transcription elongation factor GreB [alpha proteobacterium U9-1i]|nr:transcription elongation factor GreB [alpha proteobacterium U9-1i]